MTEQAGFSRQRICIKFCQKLCDRQAQTIGKIKKAFSDDAMGQHKLRSGIVTSEMTEHLLSDKCFGRTTTSKNPKMIEKMHNLVMDHCQIMIQETKNDGYSSVQVILTDVVGMHRVAAKFVPELLTRAARSSF